MSAYMEVVHLQLKSPADEAEFLIASDRFTREVAANIPGMERRELLRVSAGGFLLLVRYTSLEQLEAAPKAIGGHPAASEFSSFLDFTSMVVEQHEIVASLSTSQLP